jgi:hypothetical protein
MTQTQIEQTRVIAIHDKWLEIPEGTYAECHRQTLWFGHGGKFDCYHDITAVSELKYLTSLDRLHPVAMNVMDDLRGIQDEQKSYYISSIRSYCSTAPINGEYIDLFNAVYEGIVYLNSTETK